MRVLIGRLVGAALIAILGLSLATGGTVRAQTDTHTITIHVAQCPAGYAGSDPFTDCHDNRIPGVTFQWRVFEPVDWTEVISDENGVAVITESATGFEIDEIPPFELASFSVYCSTNDGADQVPVNYFETGPRIAFPVGALTGISEVVCDWYNVPVGGADHGGTDTPTTLPGTGVAPVNDPAIGGTWLAVLAAAAGGLALGLRRRAVR